MKIAGFDLGKKSFIKIGVVVGVIAALSAGSIYQKKAEQEKRLREEQERLARIPQPTEVEAYDYHTMMQIKLTEKFGVAPDGFEWDYDGSLVPLSDETSCEDVVYTFLRSVSVLDFSTAERYSKDSSIVKSYQDYYGLTTTVLNDYYQNFLRKQLKISISSLEIVGVSDVAVFADGTEYVTVDIKALDLSYKDFWYKDKWDLFDKMFAYGVSEDDDTKEAQFVYDYLLEKYQDGTIGKKEYTVELVVEKQTNGGWLVSNDKELEAILSYESGVDVAAFIMDSYMNFSLEHITEYLPDVIAEERAKEEGTYVEPKEIINESVDEESETDVEDEDGSEESSSQVENEV